MDHFGARWTVIVRGRDEGRTQGKGIYHLDVTYSPSRLTLLFPPHHLLQRRERNLVYYVIKRFEKSPSDTKSQILGPLPLDNSRSIILRRVSHRRVGEGEKTLVINLCQRKGGEISLSNSFQSNSFATAL